jgi:hypothetical protein
VEINDTKNNDLLKIKMYFIRQQRAVKNVSNEAKPTCLQKNQKVSTKNNSLLLKPNKEVFISKMFTNPA